MPLTPNQIISEADLTLPHKAGFIAADLQFPAFKAFLKRPAGESLTKKASLNALAEALDYGARLIVGFMINPLLVSSLGSFGYGVWQVLVRLIAHIAPASGRPTQALKWTIAQQQASAGYEEKRRQLGSAVAVWFLFLPLLAVLGGLLTWFVPSWLKVPAELFWSVRLAAALLVADLIMSSLVEIPRAVLGGENLGYKRMGLSTIIVFAGGSLIALALSFNTGLIGVAVATLAATLLTGVLFLQVARANVLWFGISRPPFAAVRRFFGLSGWFFAWSFVMKLMRASDIVLLGILGSVQAVTIYSLTKYVPEALINFVAIVVFGVTPGLGGIIGSGNLQKAVRLRSEMMAFTWFIITAAGATILLWNKSFLQLWVGAEYHAGLLPTLLTILLVAQFVLIRNDANIIDLTLDLRRKVQIGALSIALSLAFAGALVHFFNAGITGLCLGFIAGRVILSLGYPWLVGRFLGFPLLAQLKSILRPAIVSLLLFGLAFGLIEFLKASTWPGLVFSSGLTFGMFSVLAFYSGLSAQQRQQMLYRVRLIVRK